MELFDIIIRFLGKSQQLTCTKDLHEPNYPGGDSIEVIELVHCCCALKTQAQGPRGGRCGRGESVIAVAFAWELHLRPSLFRRCSYNYDKLTCSCVFAYCVFCSLSYNSWTFYIMPYMRDSNKFMAKSLMQDVD